MRHAIRGIAATAMTFALTATASAQSATNYYQQIQNGYQQGAIQPAATVTYQTQQAAPQPTGQYAPQQAGTVYSTAPATAPLSIQQPPAGYAQQTTPSYGSPYVPTAPTTVYQNPNPIAQPLPAHSGTIVSQPLPALAPAPAVIPASALTSSVPSSTAPVSSVEQLQDTDVWSFNLARFFPAVQACLRKSTAKNPVVANIQVRDNKTMMLIAEGGSSTYSTCSTGLTGTTIKANSDIRNLPPAFFAPLGSTFTVTPDRPFQPIVDTDQKVIGWLVRTQPSNAVNQFGQAVGFDGQFIPPMMVNTGIGKS